MHHTLSDATAARFRIQGQRDKKGDLPSKGTSYAGEPISQLTDCNFCSYYGFYVLHPRTEVGSILSCLAAGSDLCQPVDILGEVLGHTTFKITTKNNYCVS